MIDSERRKQLNREQIRPDGSCVVYWMQASQRSEDNHALEYAIDQANLLKLPLVVWFGLTAAYPSANTRHYLFMLQGLRELSMSLAKRGICLTIEHVSNPGEGIVGAASSGSEVAALVVTDMGYLRIHREWRKAAAKKLPCPLVQIETDIVVPVCEASVKEEYSAATLRPKIRKLLGRYVVPVQRKEVTHGDPTRRPPGTVSPIDLDTMDDTGLESLLRSIGVQDTVKPVSWIRGGEANASAHLGSFLESNLGIYDTLRNDPATDYQSNMSPYLHFGQISPVRIVLNLLEAEAGAGYRPVSEAYPSDAFRVEALSSGAQAFIEELIVRRELSINFCHYNQGYDTLEAIPSWARDSLDSHEIDTRPVLYSRQELEEGRTQDRYWNAAQRELISKGKMHGYMRMYWGKKLIEWTTSASEAHSIMIELNDRYSLDGRDPNGYTGIAWCFGKHDRPWKEREIFGKVRYMNSRGLERKFKIGDYVTRIGGQS